MFLDNKYSKWYRSLMKKRRTTMVAGYGEWHHEIPKSLGGTNGKENLVKLLPREHFIAHRFLVRMLEGSNKRKMVFALKRTVSSKTHIPNSRVFAQIRELYASQLRGVKRSLETKKKISEKLTGIPLTEETKAKMSLALKGRSHSDAFKQSIKERLNDLVRDAKRRENIRESLTGHKLSEETRKKISETRKRKFLEGTLFKS